MSDFEGVYDINRDKLKKTREKLKTTGGYYRMKDNGEYVIRILPPTKSIALRGEPGLLCLKHFQVPPDSKIVTCADTWPGEFETCPICEVISDCCKERPKYQANLQPMFNAFIRSFTPEGGGDERKINKLVVFQGPYALADWLVGKLDSPRFKDMLHPETGRDIIATKSETSGGKVKYDYQLEAPRPILMSKGKMNREAIQAMLDKRIDLDKREHISQEQYRDLQEMARRLRRYLESNGSNVEVGQDESLPRADLVNIIKSGIKAGLKFEVKKGLSDSKLEGMIVGGRWSKVWNKLDEGIRDKLLILGITGDE